MQPETYDFTFRNWGDSVHETPARYYRPTSTDDVVEIVRDAGQAEAHVRVMGSGLSATAVACPERDGWLLSLDRMNRVIEVDRIANRVRVQAGIRLRDLNDILAHHGLALPILGRIAEESLAGATATGTHGTGQGFGPLGSLVESLELVTADNRRLALSRDDGDTFAAAVQSVGVLGVITELTLGVVPTFRLESRAESLPFDTVLARLDTLLADNDHVLLSYFPFVSKVRLSLQNRTNGPIRRGNGFRRWVSERLLGLYATRLAVTLGEAFPEQIPRLNKLMSFFMPRRDRLVGRSDRVFQAPLSPPVGTMEYAVPADRAAEVLRAIRQLIEGEGLPVNAAVELRWMKADTALLSAALGRDVCFVAARAVGRLVTDEYFPAFHRLMRQFEGHPHLGKLDLFDPGELLDILPGARRFEAVRRRLDPSGMFRSRYLDHLLGP